MILLNIFVFIILKESSEEVVIGHKETEGENLGAKRVPRNRLS